MTCEHSCDYDYDNWKDSKKVDGIEVLWQCDNCDKKGSHHFEFKEEESMGRDEDVWNKLVRKTERNPKQELDVTKQVLKTEIEENGYENFEDYFIQEFMNDGFCEHYDSYDDSKEDITIEYNQLHYTQTCGNCGYIRDCIYGRHEESE